MSDENLVNNYGWSSSTQPNSCNYITPEIQRILARLQPGRVLDIGCGNGSLCSEIKAKLGVSVVGMEYDQEGVDIAKASYPEIKFYRFGVQDDPRHLLEMERNQFDVVISTEVIEHLFSPQLLPRYAHGVLKAGGRLILTTPYHGYIKNLILSLANKWDVHHTPLWEGGT